MVGTGLPRYFKTILINKNNIYIMDYKWIRSQSETWKVVMFNVFIKKISTYLSTFFLHYYYFDFYPLECQVQFSGNFTCESFGFKFY